MIYLVRHGEAAAGWGSHPNPGLSETGQGQARTASEALAGLGIQQVFSSPMQRCQETAAPFVAASDLPLTIEPGVTEVPTPADVGDDRVSWLRSMMAGTWAEAPDVVQAWRAQLIETVSGLPENSVVFSHFVAINALVGHSEGVDAVTVFRPNYCSMTRFQAADNQLKLIERGQELDTRVL